MNKNKGLSVFMTKNAEVEPWLVQHAFVPPPEFEFFKGLHSSIIYAGLGSGKTAINCALSEYARNQLKCLPVRWTPDLSLGLQPPGTELAMVQFSNILSACAHEILNVLQQGSEKQAKDDRTVEFLAEFLHYFVPREDRELLTTMVSARKPFLINRDTKLEVIATELIKNLQHIGFSGGIWIMVDGVGWNSETQKQTVVNALQAILSTLSLFEISGLHFKMFLPIELERELTELPARIKERVSASRISWESKRLQIMIEKRLRIALDDNQVKADHIYSAKDLFGWLESCGGLSPRGWLEYFRPIFATVWENYESEGICRLDKDEWTTARKRSSLQLRFYPDSNQVVFGMSSPRTLSPEEMAIFSYLYENERNYCSKREIYYKAYLPYFTEGQEKEINPPDEFSKEFDDLVNSAIYRLRKVIEPLPKDPVFLTMKKNIGYRLSLQAFLD